MGLVRTRVHKDHSWDKHPWKSEKPVGSDREFSPKREADRKDVEMCLSCPVPPNRCCGIGNCYNKKTGEFLKREFRNERKPFRRVQFNRDKFLDALRQTRDNKVLAEMFDVSTPTIRKWKDFVGVPRGSKDVYELPEEGDDENGSEED